MQHATINLPPSHPVRALTGLARAIALPAEYEPQRFPSFPALERTAVMSFNQPTSLTVPASTSVKIMLARQAGLPVWADQTYTGLAYNYQYMSESGAGSYTQTSLALEPTIASYSIGNVLASGTRIGVSGGTSGNNIPAIGIDLGTGPTPYVFVPAGYNAYVTLVNSDGSTAIGPLSSSLAFNVNLDVWTAPGEQKFTQLNGTAAAANTGAGSSSAYSATTGTWIRPRSLDITAATATGWVRFTVGILVVGGTATYTPSTTTCGSWAVTAASAKTALLPLSVSSEFANSKLPWYSTRTTAAALLMTNVTQVLNKAGTVLAGRISPNVVSPFEVASTYIAALHPAEKAWLPLETGMYTFCPPSTDMAVFWDYTLPSASVAGTGATAPVYRLDNDSLVNVAFATAGSVDEVFAITSSWHIEFRTSSALFPIALSGMSLETLHQAQLALAASGFFFDNPDHKAILNAVIGGIRKVAPSAMAAIKAYNPAVAAALSSGQKLLSKAMTAKKVGVPESKMAMPTTSPKASGIEPRHAGKGKSKGKGKKQGGRKKR